MLALQVMLSGAHDIASKVREPFALSGELRTHCIMKAAGSFFDFGASSFTASRTETTSGSAASALVE